MPLNFYDVSAGVFVRGLTNLKMQLAKAEEHIAASGASEAALLDARLPAEGEAHATTDLHSYTLAAQVHWAAEGARLAMVRLLDVPRSPTANLPATFSELHRRLDETIAYLRECSPGDLEASVDKALVVDHRRGAVHTNGGQFLIAYALPHFFYHVTSAYAILRSQGVPLTMGDFLGNWGAR